MNIETYGVLEEVKKRECDKNPKSTANLIKQYEEVIVKSLLTSFGLDFLLIQDRHGGDVDTIHNVRKMHNGDTKFDGYANVHNANAYLANGTYDKTVSSKYHGDKRYIERNREGKYQKIDGTLGDAYSGRLIRRDEDIDLDHVIAAKNIHDDPGRVLAELNGVDLANDSINLKHTNRSINRSKGKKTVEEFTMLLDEKRHERQGKILDLKSRSELTSKERKELEKLEMLESVDTQKIKAAEEAAREKYEKQLSSTYYTSPKFLNDTLKASAKLGFNMGLRQALGTILASVWMIIREEFPKLMRKLKKRFDLGDLFSGLSDIFKKAFDRVKQTYRDVIQSFANGVLAGILSSLTTTFINIFMTSAKNVTKIIRESFATVVEAVNILVFNPDNLPFGEVLKSIAILLSTTSSVILGTIVSEAVSHIPALKLPIIGDSLPAFVGAAVTGLMSVSLLHFIENSPIVVSLVQWANQLKTSLDYKLDYYRAARNALVTYAAELSDIDLDDFEQKVANVSDAAHRLRNAQSSLEMNSVLSSIVTKMDIKLPYDGSLQGLDDFMNDNQETLRFQL